MTNDVMSCISNALYKEFCYVNHMEEIKQDLKGPCFFVTLLDSATQIVVGNRYEKRNQICIQYFPESEKNQKNECNDVAERLTVCLEYIEDEDGGFLHGTDMHYQITDGILNFFVNYNFHVFKQTKQEEPMHDMTIQTKLGGE